MAAAAIVPAGVIGSLINLDHPGHYLHWGFFQMSLANFIVIIVMIVVFCLALVVPFPHKKGGGS